MKDMSFAIARTGRVQSWLDNPDGRKPVSCTVINVKDWMRPTDDGHMTEERDYLRSKINYLDTVHSEYFDGNYPEIIFDDGITSSGLSASLLLGVVLVWLFIFLSSGLMDLAMDVV